MVSLMTALIETVHFQVSDVVVLLGSCIECLYSNGGCSVCTTAATLTFLPLMTGVFLKSAIIVMDQLSRVTSDGCWGPMAAASEAGIVPSHGLRQSHDQPAMRASSLARSAS